MNNCVVWSRTSGRARTIDCKAVGQVTRVAQSNYVYALWAHCNVERSYLINGLNRIMNVCSTAFSYDGRGNLTNDGTNAFTYTAENLLKTSPGGATLAYDPLGRLYQQVGGGTTTRFQYDGIDLFDEYKDRTRAV